MQGDDILVIYRVLNSNNPAVKPAGQTSYEVTLTVDEGETTKDGQSQGNTYEEASVAWELGNDGSYEELRQAVIDGPGEGQQAIIEYWETNVSNEQAGKYESYYRQANITEITKTADSGSSVTVEMSLAIHKLGKHGYTELTQDIQEAVDYAFKTITEAETEAGVTTVPRG